MKNIILLFVSILIASTTFGQGKGTKEVQFKVSGICGMCKKRIEETANLAKGVKSASWDKETDVLTLVYKEGKTTPEEVGKKLAKAGHDNDYAKATKEQYESISNCCRYKTQEKH